MVSYSRRERESLQYRDRTGIRWHGIWWVQNLIVLQEHKDEFCFIHGCDETLRESLSFPTTFLLFSCCSCFWGKWSISPFFCVTVRLRLCACYHNCLLYWFFPVTMTEGQLYKGCSEKQRIFMALFSSCLNRLMSQQWNTMGLSKMISLSLFFFFLDKLTTLQSATRHLQLPDTVSFTQHLTLAQQRHRLDEHVRSKGYRAVWWNIEITRVFCIIPQHKHWRKGQISNY